MIGKSKRMDDSNSIIENTLDISKVPYMFDRSGRIYLKGDKVYRIIEDRTIIEEYRNLLVSDEIEDLYKSGLVRTKIIEKYSNDEMLILEHEKIPYILHPCEYSNKMFWEAAYMFVELNLKLSKKGFVTHDAHPWNVTYNGQTPVFYDFGSIIKKNNVNQSWFDEFFMTFAIPIWLAGYNKRFFKFSKEYRRENGMGFGWNLFKLKWVKKIVFRKFYRIAKLKSSPEKIFGELLKWLDKYKPIGVTPQYWSEYYGSENLEYDKPASIKQKYVHNILSSSNPKKVLDLASNKGYYTFMAAHLGASVMAFDYEEEIVDNLRVNSGDFNITTAHIDFRNPTASLGVGFFWGNSYKRFQSDIVLALGLIHHICITQNIPVYLFCAACKQYAEKGIILEFVHPTDKHVASWSKKPSKDYSIEKIKMFMKDKFANCDIGPVEKNDGLHRSFLYFYN